MAKLYDESNKITSLHVIVRKQFRIITIKRNNGLVLAHWFGIVSTITRKKQRQSKQKLDVSMEVELVNRKNSG